MENFAVRFLALDRVPKFIPACFIDSEEKQLELLTCTLLKLSVVEFPLPRAQVQALLEAIVRTCEDSRVPVHEQVYELLAHTLNDNAEREVFGHYVIGSKEVKFRVFGDSSALVQNGSTGFMTWEAGKCLAWYLSCVDRPAEILELGCGTGVTGVVTAMHVNGEYTFTDYHESTLENARANWATNKLTTRASAKFEQLDFLALDQNVDAPVIVGADILYDLTLSRGLVAFLENPGVRFREALIMSTIRTEVTYEAFKQALEQSSVLTWESVYRLPFSDWCDLPQEPEWKQFLASATLLFDPEIELIRVKRK